MVAEPLNPAPSYFTILNPKVLLTLTSLFIVPSVFATAAPPALKFQETKSSPLLLDPVPPPERLKPSVIKLTSLDEEEPCAPEEFGIR